MSRYPSTPLTGASPGALSWLSGSWLGRNGDDSVEEHWSPVRGNTVVGMFLWEDKDRAHEFVLVQLGDREAVFLERDKPDARWTLYRLEGDRLLSYFATNDAPITDTGLFEYTRA